MDDLQVFGKQDVQNMIDTALRQYSLKKFKLFGLNGTKDYATKVAQHVGVSLTPHTERLFDDGECYVKSGPEHSDSSIGNVRGHNVFVIQSLYSDATESVSDKLVKLLMFCGSLKDASARSIIPIIPHMAWARQDRKTESRAPIATKYVARMLESVGVNHVLMIDAHNLSAEQNAFNVPIDNLEAKNLFAHWCATNLIQDNRTHKIRVLTPDSGGLSRAERFRNVLLKILNNKGVKLDDIEIVYFDKLRVRGEVRGGRIVGDVADANVILLDDMISTASTVKKAVKATIEANGRVYAICATHGLFCGKANDLLGDIDSKIVVSDTIAPWRLNDVNKSKLCVIDTTKMVGDAILRIHSGTGSISELLRA